MGWPPNGRASACLVSHVSCLGYSNGSAGDIHGLLIIKMMFDMFGCWWPCVQSYDEGNLLFKASFNQGSAISQEVVGATGVS